MKYPWIDEYLLSKTGVTKDLQADWNWVRYYIGGKMFAAVLLDREDKPYYINLKLDPLEGELMRQQYPDIIPGYYSNKCCWNSVKPDGDVPDEVLKKLLDHAYDVVFKSLTKKKQKEILEDGISPVIDSLTGILHGHDETDAARDEALRKKNEMPDQHRRCAGITKE